MACTLSVQHLIIIVLINSSSVPISAKFTAASSDYKEAESLIRIEIQKFTDDQLSKDIKLTKVLDRKLGTSSFYPYQNVSDEKPLFSWKSKKSNSEEKIIIIGNQANKNSKNEVSQVWMSGAFIALRKVKSTSSNDMAHYYAQIVYVRKDFGEIVVEWDRWSPKIVKRRETEVEATNGFTIDTFLCAYGTCSCTACKCSSRNEQASQANRDIEDDDEDTSIIERVPLRPKRTRKKFGVATALAYSRKGNALTSSIVKGKGGSRSVAFAETGTAFSGSMSSNDGDSTALSRGHDTALSEAQSRDGDTKSLAVSNIGVAQSSSKSRGGLIEAKAAHTGLNDDWDFENSDDDEEEYDNIDAKSLISDTSTVFSEVAERAKMANITASSAAMIDDECFNEHVIDVQVTLNEWETLMEKDSFRDENENEPEPIGGGGVFPYKNPLRYGIDVDIGVNSSIRIVRKIRGAHVPRTACCGLDANPSMVLDFLKTFQQNCNPDLEAQVARLENSLHKSNLSRVLKTRKLSLSQLKDLVPSVLLRMYKSESTLNAKSELEDMTNGKTSDTINWIVAIVINAARFATNEAHYHKIKILKGLSFNTRTVWTGIMLEYKKCRKKRKGCDSKYMDKLEAEKELVLSLYLFLRFADARYSTYTKKEAFSVFYDFYKLHHLSISKLASCKSRSIIFNTATSRTI